jgi:hypothetical protein
MWSTLTLPLFIEAEVVSNHFTIPGLESDTFKDLSSKILGDVISVLELRVGNVECPMTMSLMLNFVEDDVDDESR